MSYFLVVCWPLLPVEIVVVGGVDHVDPLLFRHTNQLLNLLPANPQDYIHLFFGQRFPFTILPLLAWWSFDAMRRHDGFC